MSVIALLSPGALGVHVGMALAQRGNDIVCPAGERSEATRQRAQVAGFRCADSLTEAIGSADVIISAVPPSHALDVARQIVSALGVSQPLYIDMNSVSPATADGLLELLPAGRVRPVKASIFGPPNVFGPENVAVLSGGGFAEAAQLLASSVRVMPAGTRFAAAASVKMATSMVTKGLPALFLETLAAAGAAGQAELLINLLDVLYPGIMRFLRRTLPTYPRHVGRRIDEMREVQRWLEDLAQPSTMIGGGILALESLYAAGLSAEPWEFGDLVAALVPQTRSSGAGATLH